MQSIDLVVTSEIKLTPRVIQLCGSFDVPIKGKLSHQWKMDVDIDERPWSVGLINGPSGCGKTQIARNLFGEDRVDATPTWQSASMIDDFPKDRSLSDIVDNMNAVGFNTIPSWLKPFAVLSNGEQFRASIARMLLESDGLVVVDEFTSVVDRTVAKIACHAVQRAVRKTDGRFVAVTCHDDVEDWLQPDWVLDPVTQSLRWRSLQPRPQIECKIARVTYQAWQYFAPYHYMSADMHKAARCICLFVGDQPATFVGILPRPNSHKKRCDIYGVSRLVTRPEYQGLGLAFVLLEAIGSAYRHVGKRLRTYPAHIALIRSFERSKDWIKIERAGKHKARNKTIAFNGIVGILGGRPNGVYEYVGPSKSEFTGLVQNA